MTIKDYAKRSGLTQEQVVEALQFYEPQITIWHVKHMYRKNGPRQPLKYCIAVERWSDGEVSLPELGWQGIVSTHVMEQHLSPLVIWLANLCNAMGARSEHADNND